MTAADRVTLFAPSLTGGGAERVMVSLAGSFARRGLDVELVLARRKGAYLADVPAGLNVIDLGTRRALGSVRALIRYLRQRRPRGLLSTLNTANCAAIVATRLSGVPTRVVVRQANTVSLSARTNRFARLAPTLVRCCYRWADAVVAVSEGVAADLVQVTRAIEKLVRVIPNPVITEDVLIRARDPLDHPWFAPGAPPVVLGTGRLAPQKDFATLMRAFAILRQRVRCRLLVLGEGEARGSLERLSRELGLQGDVALPGFVPNPFPYMARAGAFALSSAWEGLPGALIQALACGAPVVATDCRSGPREILRAGRYGRLVPVGDAAAMAAALEATLTYPPPPAEPVAWSAYTEGAAVDEYLKLLFANGHG